jgi:hypothetical protein
VTVTVVDPCGVAIASRTPAGWTVACSCNWARTGHHSDVAALHAHAVHAGTSYWPPRVSTAHRGGTR